jgi:DnaJ-class molecular chaperone
MRDPYEVLGVSRSASDSEVKKAFRSLAKKHHPDTKGGDPAAQKRFQEISAAYDILGDKDKRAKYDSGEIDAAGNPRGFDPRARGYEGSPFGHAAAGGGGRDFRFTWTNQGDAAEGYRAEDIFSDLFGGLGGGRRGGRGQTRKGEDLVVTTTVSFDEAGRGGTRRVVLPNGDEIDVKIPAGLKDGQQIRLKGRGSVGRAGGQPGDVLISVSVAPHPWLTRDGNNLRMDLPVTLREAVLGAKVPIPTLTGTVTVTVPANSNTGNVLRLKGKGIATPSATGDLYVRLVVALPDKPDAELKTFAENWQTAYDPRSRMR